MASNVIPIPGLQGSDPANEKTQRIDTTSGPVAAALNLDFLDLPEDMGLTAPPAAPSAPAPFPQFAPPPQPQPASATADTPANIPADIPSKIDLPAVGNPGFNPMDQNAPSAVSRISPISSPAGRYLRLGALFLGSFIVVGGAVFYLNSVMQHDADSHADLKLDDKPDPGAKTPAGAPVEKEESLFAGILHPVLEMLGLAEEEQPAALPDKPAAAKVAAKAAPKPAKSASETGDENDEGYPDGNVDVAVRDPYRVIINEIDKDALGALNKARRPMSVIEQDGWRAGVDHKFQYQHYRAVEEMRAYRAAGSEDILRRALDDSSLWVRMTAAFALVESGVPLMASEIEKAVGQQERRNLLNGYFQRFTRSNNLAERYVLKFALPLVPEAARVDILKALVNGGDPDAELFVIAGSFDPSRRVRAWATNWLARHPSALLRIDEYRGALETWKLTDILSSNVALARAGDPAGRDPGSPGSQTRATRRAFADRPVAAPGAGVAGAAQLMGAGAGEGTQVEFYRRD